jgi:hypothetical protein
VGLTNAGLGPAKITDSKLILDDEVLGDLSRSIVDELRDRLSLPVATTTLSDRAFLEAGYEEFLLSVESYDEAQHREFCEWVESRLRIVIHYESIYGGDPDVSPLLPTAV